ncbi:MAG TPA: heparan-alpha-glucosaminide N-acetyltransferase domain-containing protein [Chryseosolibacter sp.]|nr:heparan-alpha-glucosaminide N-acetyltransferase domain-containing protein [Chryseosolibacter sp.]
MARISPDTLVEALHASPTTALSRIHSVDFLRGLVMVLMAIDHVRVYSGVPPGGPEVSVFLTRWVTHFCAPAFAFFAGTSALLYGVKCGEKSKLVTFLLTRGLILVVLEITVVRFFWTFNLNYSEFFLAGVIWMLGWSMVLLAGLVWMRPAAVGLVGVAIIVLQQLFAFVPNAIPAPGREGFSRFWEFIYPSGYESLDGVTVLYSIIPWIGVMAAGYGFGLIVKANPERRKKICLAIGGTAIGLYIVMATAWILNNPSAEMPFILQLLNQQKYPASQLFLMMTLGPIILAVPFVERVRGVVSDVLVTFGRVPFFYYLMHILVIHLTALAVNYTMNGSVDHGWYNSAPYVWLPEEFRWNLPLLYLVFAIDLIILYALCRWYVGFKSRRADSTVLKYI